MEISKSNILETIQKMVMAGKQLPQKDRIRFSKDPAAEEQLVLTQTAQLWWDLFKSQHIGVERWELATQKALMVSGVNKLDIVTVNPGLMSYSLELVEKEHLERQRIEAEQVKQTAKTFAEANCRINVPALWNLHKSIHKRPLIDLSDYENIRGRLPEKYSDEYIKKNLLALQIFYCFVDHAKRDNVENPLKLEFDKKGYLAIAIVA